MWVTTKRGIVPIYNWKGVMADEILYGMEAELSEEQAGGFCKIKTEYGYEGYAKSECFIWDIEAPKNIKFVIWPYADVLMEPQVKGKKIISIPKGARVEILPETDNGYQKIKLYNGMDGYIKSTYLGEYYDEPFTKEEDIFRERVIEIAKSYMGVQYRWGGKTPLGIDCSGLTFMAYYLCGVTIYRDAILKSGYPMHPINEIDLKPGDLIYYEGHVTMYIGNGEYIHATGRAGSDAVVINSFNEGTSNYREDLASWPKVCASLF
ncbi:MAG: SH3 domain-containing C40 family peptidase [Lachnospiraceae bacterium]|nr:SH3 domain-containing C40 family peptidase [Lachnospiraceae bacterium]